ncbi:putative cysteine proteinase [Lyophyllum shimeji]|uniref:Cysteine proteinase n=1 Tax=Lyophyllum shimeji TaxID=47721 RepID=A0A9P3UK76_LYOSH|nr:putative cysteine proteinase [Lyophyllum shimeji]
MNPRKRQAAETLLPLHSAKQRRTRMTGYDGGNPSASEEAHLLSRWKRFGKEFGDLALDTFKTIVGIRQDVPEDRELLQSLEERDQTRLDGRPPPVNGYRCANECHTIYGPLSSTDDIKASGDLDVPSQIPYPPSTPPKRSIEAQRGDVSSVRPDTSWSSTSYTQSGNAPLGSVPPPQRKTENGVIPRRYKNREHIFARAHKASVRAETQRSKEEMQRQIYNLKRKGGYTSNFADFQSLLAYEAKLEKLEQLDVFSPSSSMIDLHAKQREPSPRRNSYPGEDDVEFLRRALDRALDRAKATLNEPRPPRPFQPSLEQLRISQRLKDKEVERLLRPKLVPPTPLPLKDDTQVDVLLRKRGVVSKYAREQVNDTDLSRLLPGQWLNDEIINFYGALIIGRWEESKENPFKQGTTLLNVHYFSSFFWAKLKEGYEKGRLAKWTKKVDIFSKDVVLIPINHSNAHWTSAAINFRRKRIESYDSMGTRRDNVFKALRAYLDAEHRNKKKKPFDFTGWKDYSIEEPQQENGYDCGVFTCQYLQGLSRGDDSIRFTQKDMPHLRRRMIWEIGNARLRDEP